MVQKNDVMPSNFVVRDVAVFLGQVLKQQDRIRRTKLAEREPEEVPLEAGRKAIRGGPGRIVVGQIIPGRGCHLVSLLRG